jgi:hypothetical protein
MPSPNVLARAAARPRALRRQHLCALHQASRQRQHQHHRHVGGVLGQHRRRVGHRQPRRVGRLDVDIVKTVAELRDQFHAPGQPRDELRVQPVGDRTHQHAAALERHHQIIRWNSRVRRIEARLEQRRHPVFHRFGQAPRDEDFRFVAAQEGGLSRTIKVL